MNTFLTIFYEDFLTTIFLERIMNFDEPVFDEFFDENILDNNFWTNTFSLQKTFSNNFLTIKNFDDNFFTTTLMQTFLKRTSDKKILDGKSKK